jgi:hypothetical protein
MVEAVEQGADDVVEVDPRHVLAPARHRPADPQAEEGQHLAQRAAARREHDAGPGHGDTQPGRGRERLPLPGDDDAGEEVLARSRLLIERRVVTRAVVAGRRLRDEGPRA